ncbi:alpha/beta hydrolase family protein [Luteimonas cucumeris]|uniref:Alpha/beta hydrolase family protein n=1 Tax=Luteimonas cucumeris TaxID=985012 RepID=A0A562KYL0_9GAMM|nr:alpha/beta hydrolase [Luteimonas cucumeris]TWI00274.1 alpha/beta hydrolase family protein [Luteimonas cucumeris]
MRSALLVHGAGGGGWEWNLWRGVLAQDLRVDAPDLQPVPAGLQATAFDDYLSQVRDALHALPRPRALIGASLGGLLCAVAAEAADALVLVNPMPPAPFHDRLPQRSWTQLVPWHRDARLAATRRAMPDADDAAALYAFRRWRDESGAVLDTAQAGVVATRPDCPVLCIVSELDEDVPATATRALAEAWQADLIRRPSASHVAPLLGRGGVQLARRVAAWLSAW